MEHKYAEIKNNIIRNIHYDTRDFDTFISSMPVDCMVVDLTGTCCEIGWMVNFNSDMTIKNMISPKAQMGIDAAIKEKMENGEELEGEEFQKAIELEMNEWMYKDQFENQIYKDVDTTDVYRLIIDMMERIDALEARLTAQERA